MTYPLFRFRPLSGSYISQSVTWILEENARKCFRPLSGSYISQCCTPSIRHVININVSVPYRGATFLNFMWPVNRLKCGVSVPYRGATFLNNEEDWRCGILQWWFPSPIGELHFSITFRFRFLLYTLFPSPIGELHFSMIGYIERTWIRVSVPYRGATFLNTTNGYCLICRQRVSVPYRGATFLNNIVPLA